MVKVLVVEDEASIREVIALNLRRSGMEVLEAGSAEVALALLEQAQDCSAAILDVMLPGMNGFSLCETIRRSNQKIGIIILSAKGQEQDKIRGLSIGADCWPGWRPSAAGWAGAAPEGTTPSPPWLAGSLSWTRTAGCCSRPAGPSS